MADPYGLFDNGSLLGEMGGMRGSASGSYAPSHQGMMSAGMMGMSDPGMMGVMMPQVPQQQQQQQPNPQAMNTYGQVPQQLHPGQVTHSPKLQHYGQYAEYGAPPSAARLHHMGTQQGAMPQHQQMAPGNPMMSQQMMQQPQYPPVHRQVNPSQHPMYSMHNNGVGGPQQPTHHHHPQPPTQQQQQPMQMNQGMMWGAPQQYPMHSQQQQQQQQPQQPSPHQHGPPPSAYAQRQHEYGGQQGPGVDPTTAQRLAHYSDEPGGGVTHIQHQMGSGKLGPMGVQQRPQGSPSYSSVAGYHTAGPDPIQTQRPHQQQQQQQQQQPQQQQQQQQQPPAQHNYSYGMPNEMSHLGQQQQQGRGGPVNKMPQYVGASYGPNGAVQSQPYQMPQQPQQQQQQPHTHGPMSDSLVPRPHYSPVTQAVPNGSPQYRPAYPQVNLSPRRPTPTPPTGSPMPPPSHTPDRHILPPISATQAQGTYRTPSPSLSPSLGQSSLQQLEQMVVPHVGHRSSPLPPPLPQTHSGPFHAPTGHSSPQVSAASGLGQTQYQSNSSVDQRQQQQQQQQLHGHSVTVPNTSTTSGVGGVQTVPNTPPNSSSVGSPSVGVSSPGNLGGGSGSNSGSSTSRQPSPMGRIQGPLVNSVPLHPGYEVQQLQQQLHQLYGMPQTPQTRQKIMEIQEQLRVLQQQPMPQQPHIHHGAMLTGMQTPPHGHEPPQPLQHTHPPLPLPPHQQQQQQGPPSSQGPSSSMGLPSSPIMTQVPSQSLPLPPTPLPLPLPPIIATQPPMGMGPMYHHSEMHSPQEMPTVSSQGHSMASSQPQPISIMSQMMSDPASYHHPSPSHPSMGLMPSDGGMDEVSRASTTELTMLPHMQSASDEMAMCLPHNEQNSCENLLAGMDSSNMMMPYNQMQEPVLTDLSQPQPAPCPPAKVRKQAKPKVPKVPKVPKPRKPKKKKGVAVTLPPVLPLPPTDHMEPFGPICDPSLEPGMDFQLLELQPPQAQQPQQHMQPQQHPQLQQQLQPQPQQLHQELIGGELPEGERLHVEEQAIPPVEGPGPVPVPVPGPLEEKPKKKSKKPKKPKVPKDPLNPDDPNEEKPPKKSKPKTPKKPKETKAPKEPREKKPKKPKEPKPPKEVKSPKEAKPPKEPKDPKPTKEPKPKEAKETKKPKEATNQKKVKSPKEKPEGSEVVVKPKTTKASKRRPTKLVLSFSKKRKRTGSTDNSDMEATPPPSPTAVEDGSSLKRRSARNTKRKKYIDDIDVAITDEEDMVSAIVAEQLDKTPKPNEAGLIKPVQFFVNPNEEDAMLVERILSMRTATKEPAEEGGESEEVEEFYVKYKNFSYLHCDWKTQEELEKGDKRVMLKIKRYKQKKAAGNNIFEFLEEEAFNPDYIEVDRILDVSCEITDVETNAQTKHFLVKWRGLAYDDSTWELEEDVDKDKVELFYKFREPPPVDQMKARKRPKPEDWKKLDSSREYKLNNTLREYQLEGVNWLTFSWYNGQNCILADEMGLGKTIQSITYLCEVVEYGIRGPFLIIAPLSTITNWQREFETWSDLNVVVYHGSAASRNMIQEYETYYKDKDYKIIPNVYKFNAMITTFEIIITDCMDLRAIPWQCVIIDEAHRLKNKNCKLLEGLRLLQMEHRVLLSGTPLQNNVEELFSLLNFLEPAQFPSSDEFLREFGDLKSESQVQKLQQLLKPMMLRRLKEDVEKSLAPKEETIIEVELTNIQKKYYRAILERNFSFLAKGGGAANIPNLMNTMMELRKCCIHPYLINGAEEQIQSECRTGTVTEGDDTYLQAMIQSSGKLVLIDKLLPKLKDSGHRVLIFSQMVRCLDILEDYLVHRRYPFERIDGRVRGNMRQAAIDRFSKPDSDRFVFLLCTRAGGLGINLTAADTVIIFDSDWNPQNDLQAQARCHRIGQQKMVKCYRLICRNTYEREMFDKASLKLGLDKAVLQSMNNSTKDGIPPQQLSKKEIEDLLRKGAYGAIMDDDNAADKFCEEDIDQILQRRTQVIQLESGVKGSTFAKASFVASGNRSDIDINDPEFWQKWARRADIDVEALEGKNDLIVTQPRRRIQTRRFGNEDQMLELTDLESSDDDDSVMGLGRRSHKKSRSRKRKRDDYQDEFLGDLILGIWSRTECFKVEKGLLTFGWGRWMELLNTMKFKMRLQECHLEEVSRIILLYCLRFYRGDEKIKTFVFELITPPIVNDTKTHRNNSDPTMSLGLCSPPSRSRKSKKVKKEPKLSPNYGGCSTAVMTTEIVDWTKDPKYNPDVWLTDEGYKKHLQRHANKVLIRVRLLSYLKQDIIGDQVLRVAEGMHVSLLNMRPPWPDGDPPVPWWDDNADKSLLVGVYKHGFERYNVMRLDPTLSFLAKCGPPDGAAVLAEMNINETNEYELEDKVSKLDDVDDEEPLSPGTPKPESQNTRKPDQSKSSGEGEENDSGIPIFPSVSDLNTRLRRLITGYQRNHKKQEQRQAQRAKKMEKKEKFQAAVREREMRKKELQQRKWSRREEADFYRVVASFGVEFIASENRYDWTRFRNLARLEKKYDDTVTEYYKAFYVMCKKVCGKKVTEEEENQPIFVEPITEERARRCLERVDLLNKIREEILPHPELEERLKLCKPSMDLPEWWICGKHDKDLLVGAARHGLGRMDYQLLHDPALSFHEVLRNYKPNKQTTVIQTNTRSSSALNVEKTEEEVMDSVKEEAFDLDVKPSHRIGKSFLDDPIVDDVKPSKEMDRVKKESDEENIDKVPSEEMDADVGKDKDKIVGSDSTRDDVKAMSDEVADEVAVVESVEQKEEADVVNDIVTNAIDTVVEESEKENTAVGVTDDKDTKELEMTKENGPVSEIEKKVNEKETEDEGEFLKVRCTKSPVKLSEEESNFESITEKAKETSVSECEKESPELEKVGKDLVQEPTLINGDAKSVTEVDSEDTEKGLRVESETKDVETDDESKIEMITKDKKKLKEQSLASADDELESEKPDEVVERMSKLKDENNEEKTEEKTEKKVLNDSPVEKFTTRSSVKDEEENKIKDEDCKNLPSDLQVIRIKEEEPGSVLAYSTSDLYASTTFGLEMISGGADSAPAHLLVNSFHNPIRWPKDRVLQMRLEAVVQCIEKNEWPTLRYAQIFPLQSLSQSNTPASVDMDSTPQVTPDQTPKRETTPWNTPTHPSEKDGSDSNPATETIGNAVPYPPRRRRRRRRIEIEAERAKLQALLSQNLNHNQLKIKYPIFSAENTIQEPSKSVSSITISPIITTNKSSSSSSVAPPPAHQHNSMRAGTQLLGTLDLGRKIEALRQEETQAPMDLSSSLKTGPSFGGGDQSDRSSVDGVTFGVADGLVMDLQLRRTKKMRLEEQLAKIKNQKVGCDTFIPANTSSNLNKVDDQRQRKRRKLDEIVGSLAASAAPITTPAPAHSSSLKTTMVTNVPSEPIVKKPITTSAATTMAAAAAAAVAAKAQLEPNLRSNHLLHLASKRLDVEKWLADHSLQAMARRVETARPVMTPDPMDLLDGRRRRRPRLDPNKLSLDHLTGNENVSVINRLTGKKITGSKAPPLKHLAEWLKQNPMFDVDSKWAHLVKEKNLGMQASLPDDVKKRILFPSGRRGRRPTSSSTGLNPPTSTPPRSVPSSTASLLSSTYSSLPGLGALGSLANANMLAGFPNLKLPGMSDPSRGGASAASAASSPMFLPFGGLASLGLTNPLFANLAGLGFAGFPFASSLSGLTPGNPKGSKDLGSSGIGSKASSGVTTSTTSSAAAAASLPLLFPAPGLLYNPLGLGNFPLPTSIPSSFASLAHASLVNGMTSQSTSRMGSSVTATTSSAFGSRSATIGFGNTGSSAAVNAATNGMIDDSDDDSLRSLMGNNYDDDDSTATDEDVHRSRQPQKTETPSRHRHVHQPQKSHQPNKKDLDIARLMAAESKHQSRSSKSRTSVAGQESRPRTSLVEQEIRHRSSLPEQEGRQRSSLPGQESRQRSSLASQESRQRSLVAGQESRSRTLLVGQESRPRRSEQSMADKFEAKALQRSMMQMMEAKTLERSRRAERRSNDKIHRTERTLSRTRASMTERLAEAMAADAKERQAAARDLSLLSALSVSMLAPKTSVAQDAATNLVLPSTSDSKSPVSKPVELVRRTSSRSVEESRESSSTEAVRTEVEASGERIRALSEKLKEKLHRAEEVCREFGVGSCTTQKSDESLKTDPPVVCRPSSAAANDEGTTTAAAASVGNEEPPSTDSKPDEGDDEKS